jgi:hypothetical protein
VAVKRNPKQEGTNFFDCIPQVGPCPIGCNQCFYNRPGAYYVPIDQPHVPTPEEVGDGIVRMNCGNDSNNNRELVIATAQQYEKFFFNTSVRNLDFPGPVVLTANPREEEPAWCPNFADEVPNNLMFIRLRVSGTNLHHIDYAARWWTMAGVPVVLTFMAYYDCLPDVADRVRREFGPPGDCYEWRVRHINSYWCATKPFMRYVMRQFADNRLVSMCSSINSGYCRDCRNCETYYVQTMKRMRGE